jgi:hypothetical protein
MKLNPKISKIIILILFFLLFLLPVSNVFSQENRSENAVKYMDSLSKSCSSIKTSMWDYIKTSAHSKDIQLVIKKRKELIKTVKNSIKSVKKIDSFDGDNSLKETVLKYLNTMHLVLIEDYGKLVDMKKIAEESYDMMEAYFLAKEKAGEKGLN